MKTTQQQIPATETDTEAHTENADIMSNTVKEWNVPSISRLIRGLRQ